MRVLIALVVLAAVAGCGPQPVVPCARDAQCVEAECSECQGDRECIDQCGSTVDVPGWNDGAGIGWVDT